MTNELDALKNLWQNMNAAGNKKQLSKTEIEQLVKGKSNNELQKIRHKLIVEWTAAIIISVIMVITIGIINPADILFAIAFLLIILGISFIPYTKIIRMQFTQNNNLKNHLTQVISGIELLITQYTKLSTILIPIAAIGGFLLGFHSASNLQQWSGFFEWLNIVLLFVLAIIIGYCGNRLQRYYFKWVYGKNIQRLRDCLSELSENDS